MMSGAKMGHSHGKGLSCAEYVGAVVANVVAARSYARVVQSEVEAKLATGCRALDMMADRAVLF